MLGICLLVIGIALLSTNIVGFGLVISTRNIPSAGAVTAINVGVYQDTDCTVPLTSWNWGIMEPGSSALKKLYIRNEGNSPMTLNMATKNWNPPEAATYMTITWNKEGAVFNPDSVVEADVTLIVAANVAGITNFSFDTIITGTG